MIKKLVLAALPSLALAIAAPAFAQSTMSAPTTTAPATTAAPSMMAPTAAKPAKPAKPAKAAKAGKAGKAKSSPLAKSFKTESEAKTACGSDTVVWVNTGSKVYHVSGSKYYGKTKHGVYACAADATAAGYHAAKK